MRGTFVSAIGMCVVSLLIGCTNDPGTVPQTEGERIKMQGKLTERKGDMMLRGERLVADGRGLRARGEALRDQGKSVDGEKLIAEGDAKIREGEATMRRAEGLPTEPLTSETAGHRTDSIDRTPPPSTQPDMR